MIEMDKRLALHEFLELYCLMVDSSMIDDDRISIGNLATFVDYFHSKAKWNEKKQMIRKYLKEKAENNLNYYIAKNLYHASKELDISDNLEFKLDKMSMMYKDDRLKYFDIILDEYEFPDWFKEIMYCFPMSSSELFYNNLLNLMKGMELLNEEGNLIGLAYLSEKIYKNKSIINKLTNFNSLVWKGDENEVAWFLANLIFGLYYPELGKMYKKDEQSDTLCLMSGYKRAYQKGELKYFDLFSTNEKSKMRFSYVKQ